MTALIVIGTIALVAAIGYGALVAAFWVVNRLPDAGDYE